jgi:ribosomal protein L40E
MITVISCVLASVVGSGSGGAPIIGITLMIISAVLWRKTSTKVCPACAERVKYQARKCRYCGADLVD